MASAGKVLIIVQNLPVPFDRRVWLEATSLERAGYQVAVICPTGKSKDYQARSELIDRVHIYRYPAPPEAHSTTGYLFEFIYCWLMTAWLSIKVFFRHGFNIIHACNPPETYFFLAYIYKLFGVKFIFDHHDLSPEMYLAKGGKKDGFFHRNLLRLERLTFRTADAVITTNQSHREIAERRGNVKPEAIFIVRSGPDFARLKIMEPEPELKEGYPFLACYLGEMCAQDGVDLLLDTIKIIVHEIGRKDICFVLMGGGPELDSLKAYKADLDLDGYVRFTGRVSDLDLCRYLSTADICLDPDPYTEWANQSTMNKIMEYMAFGKPIVAFNLKEHRYSAQSAAEFAEPNDIHQFARLVVDLIDQPERRKSMGEAGKQRVSNELAWDYSVPNLLAAYQYREWLK